MAAHLGLELGIRHHSRQRHDSALSAAHPLSPSSLCGGSKHRLPCQHGALSCRLRRSDWIRMVKIRVVDIDGHCVADRFRAYLAAQPDFPNVNSPAPASCRRNAVTRIRKSIPLQQFSGILLLSAQSTPERKLDPPRSPFQHPDDERNDRDRARRSGNRRVPFRRTMTNSL